MVRRVFFIFMPIFYQKQGEVETLSVKNANSSYRLHDQRQILYGSRGSKYDELVYLRGQNTDDTAVNTKSSDAWNKFASGQGVTITRVDHQKRDFFEIDEFP